MMVVIVCLEMMKVCGVGRVVVVGDGGDRGVVGFREWRGCLPVAGKPVLCACRACENTEAVGKDMVYATRSGRTPPPWTPKKYKMRYLVFHPLVCFFPRGTLRVVTGTL